MILDTDEKSKIYTKITPDGWALDPDVWLNLLEKDTGKVLAINLNCDTRDSWMINFLYPNFPKPLYRQCWKSISRAYKKDSKKLYEHVLRTIGNIRGCGLSSHSRSSTTTVRIFGKPLSSYEKLPKRREDEAWIGINWALKDPDGLDYCFCNATIGFNQSDSLDQPMLIASVLTDPKIIESWDAPVLYYIPPALENINPDMINSVGSIYDPGDSATASVVWASRFRPKRFFFYDADITRSDYRPGSFQVDSNRWAFIGQGMNLSYWSSTLFLLKKNNVRFEIVSGWIPNHLKSSI